MRKIQLANDEFYHVYNRGVEKRDIFCDFRDFQRFYLSIILMNDEKDGLMLLWKNHESSRGKTSLDKFLRTNLKKKKPLVQIVAFCLNPNHYHFILKQTRDRGIERFIHRIATGHTMHFNKKYNRSGVLFQGRFRAAHISSTSQLLRMSVYVNCNSEIHGIENSRNYKWSSYPEYLGKEKRGICNKKIILSHFGDIRDYEAYVTENKKDFREIKEGEKIMLLE